MNYKELKTETEFVKKLIADLISRFGDSLDAIAYSWMVYALTGSASLTAITFAINTLVSVLLSPFSAALITNWNKKLIMVLGDIGRGSLVALTALLFFMGWLQPWMVMVITGLNSTIEAFRNPAGTSIFPLIVSKEKYTVAVSLSGALTRIAEVVGMALAGVIIGLLGVAGALLIDAVTFFLSAGILMTLKLPKHIKKVTLHPYQEFKKDTKEGFAYVVKYDVILAICVTAALINFALTPILALQTAYVAESLQLNAQALSVIGIALGLGMVLGSLIVPKLLSKLSRHQLLLVGLFGLSLSFGTLYFIPMLVGISKWIGLASTCFILGISSAFANTVVQIAFMEKVDQVYLARVSGIVASLCIATMPIASFLSAWLVNYMAITTVLLMFGILAVMGSVITLFIKPLRKL